MRIHLTLILTIAVKTIFAEQDSLLVVQDTISFKKIIQLDANPVESQGQTGTCWSFSTASFLESELIRMKKGRHNLSEMLVARQVYIRKAENYIGRHGKA